MHPGHYDQTATDSPEITGPVAPGKLRFRATRGFVLHEADGQFPYGRLVKAGQEFEIAAENAASIQNFVKPHDIRGHAPIVTNVLGQ
jgi:hypothetical protein